MHAKCLFLALACSGLASAGAEPLDAAGLAKRHQAALASIKQLSLRVEIEYLFPLGDAGVPKFTEWTQDGDDIAMRYESGGTETRHSWRKGVMKTLTAPSAGTPGKAMGGFSASRAGITQLQDPWNLGLLRAEPIYSTMTFADLLHPKNRHAKELKVSTGKDGLVRATFKTRIKALGKSFEHEVAFDPARNCLVVSFATKAGGYAHTAKVLSFQEPAHGCFFPKEAEHVIAVDGKVTTKRLVKFRDVKINKAVPATAFDLKFPAGTTVVNQFLALIYVTDDDEKPTGTGTPLPPPPGVSWVPAKPDKE